jgi:hypothetical protein
MKHPKLTCEVVTLNAPTLSEKSGEGWGDDAVKTEVLGQVANLSIKKDGELEFSIQIMPTGRLIFTDYRNRIYRLEPVRNLQLDPERNWKTHP